jgi:Lon protease-like protein
MDEIGLFPLGIVLVPGELTPLHIFEERYRELIEECLERETEFGLINQDRSGIRSVGTRAAVVEVLRRFPDGRLNIVTEGRGRFRLLEMTEGRSFLTARVEELADTEGEGPPTEEELAECLQAYDRLTEAAGVEPVEEATELERLAATEARISFRIAGRIEFQPKVKQELLEMRSERARVVRLTGLLEEAAELVAFRQVVRERAAGNGHVER